MKNQVTNFSRNKPIIQYFLLAFGISWTVWVIFIIFPVLSSINSIGIMIGAFGPLIAAIILTYRNEGVGAVKNLLKRGIDYKIGAWYLPIFFLYPLCLAGAFLILAITGFIPTINNILNAIIVFALFPYMLIVGGPLGESLGGEDTPLIDFKINGIV